MKKVRVLVVDDSATMRRLISEILSKDPEIEVIGGAPEPAIARNMIKELNPDVITLDVEMPHMNGLEFLEKIMRLRPMPVVMVSTLTQRGAEVTLEALELGAVDYFAKPKENAFALLASSSTELADKVKTAARAKVRARAAVRNIGAIRENLHSDFRPSSRLVAIGSSTGGVDALIEVLSHFPENCPPTLITQHMPAGFTKSFADRLNRLCRPVVAEATEGAALEKGHVYLAPGGEYHLKLHGNGKMRCHLSPDAPVNNHRPSVDVLFNSVASSGHEALGVILTGMGRDGALGLKAMRDAGSPTIGQDESTCVVYGMPRAALEVGAVAEQLPLEKIGSEILRLCNANHVEVKHASRV